MSDRHYHVIVFDAACCFLTSHPTETEEEDEETTGNAPDLNDADTVAHLSFNQFERAWNTQHPRVRAQQQPNTTKLGHFVLRIFTVARFWAELLQHLYRCKSEWGDIDITAAAMTRRERARFHSNIETVIRDHFPSLIEPIVEAKERVQNLHEAHIYLRRMQLSEVMRAIDCLILEDLLAEMETMAFSSEQEKEHVCVLMQVLYEEIMPRALAALWLWKTHERFKADTIRDDKDVRMLWLAVLKLRAVTELSYTSEEYSAEDLELIDKISYTSLGGLFSEDECPIAQMNQPVMQYSMRDLWSMTRLLNWTWPYLCPGRVIQLFLDALWKRTAMIASVASGDTRVYNFIANIQPVQTSLASDQDFVMNAAGTLERATPKPQLWRVNDDFVTQTERIFFYMCDSVWTLRWFVRQRQDDALIEAKMLRGPLPEFHQFIEKALRGAASQFIKLQFSKSVWELSARRDEIERYNPETHTLLGNPINSIRNYHRPEYDVMMGVANALPSNIWPSALSTTEEDWKRAVEWRRKRKIDPYYAQHPFAPMECRWRSVMDLHTEANSLHSRGDSVLAPMSTAGTLKLDGGGGGHGQTKFQKILNELSFTVMTLPSGEVQYIDKVSKRRLRGQRATDAAMLYTEKRAITGRCEYDAISEDVLRTQMEFNTHPFSPKVFVVRELGDVVRLDTLTHDVEMLRNASTLCPVILRVANQYVLFDGAKTLLVHTFLCHILAEWCRYVDNQIEVLLLTLGRAAEVICEPHVLSLKDHSTEHSALTRDTVNKIYTRATDTVARLPSNLRALFKMERHSKLLTHTSKPQWFGKHFATLMVHEKYWSAAILKSNSIASASVQQREGSAKAKKAHINW